MQVMVHELKSPISGARTMAETLRLQMVKPEEQPRFLERIVARLDSMLEWIHDTLNLSKIKTGRETGELERLDLCSRIRDIAADYHEQAEAKELDFITKTPEQPIHVLLEGNTLRLILSNLISNAVKYTEAGHVRVSLAEEDGTAIVRVRDSGIGIPQEDLPRLFGEFFRASNARKSKIEGSGVGLASVKHLVERSRGSIDIESQENQGTMITVRLPVAREK
jgi:signal transduction histidine kinase